MEKSKKASPLAVVLLTLVTATLAVLLTTVAAGDDYGIDATHPTQTTISASPTPSNAR